MNINAHSLCVYNVKHTYFKLVTIVSETNDKTNMQVSPLLASGIVAIQHSNKLPVCSMFY